MALYGGVELPGRPDLANVALIDRLPISQIRRMQRVGIAIDLPYLAQLSSDLTGEMATLQRDISSYIPPDKLHQFVAMSSGGDGDVNSDSDVPYELNAASAVQIRKLLFDVLGVGAGRNLKTTGQNLPSTGRKNLDLCRDDHPVVPLILQYRERSKLKSAFCDSLPQLVKVHPRSPCCPICELPHSSPTNRLHTTFTTTRAITGRLSSKSPNLQQIPIRSNLGARIRMAFMSSPGKLLVSVDFSQMEIRDLAHLANATSMIRIYEAGGDIHQHTAMQSFGISDPAKVDKYKHRLPAKRTNFGIQNGTTGKGLLAQLISDYWAAGIVPPDWLVEEWCDDFIARWHQAYPEVQPYFDVQYYRARRYGIVWNPIGRVRRIPQVKSALPYKVSEGLREAQNFPVTSLNAEQTKLAMAETEELYEGLRSSGVGVEALLSIHDQIISEVDEDFAVAVGGLKTDIFKNVMVDKQTGRDHFRLPIEADCEVGKYWKERK